MQGDFGLDSVQMYTGSFKEALKQTMVSQEVMFRKQVLSGHFHSLVTFFFNLQELIPF